MSLETSVLLHLMKTAIICDEQLNKIPFLKIKLVNVNTQKVNETAVGYTVQAKKFSIAKFKCHHSQNPAVLLSGLKKG